MAAVLPAAALLATASSDAWSAERTVAPDIRIVGHSDDNARLREGDTGLIKIAGGFVDLGALVRWRTPTSEVQLRPRLTSSWYPGDEEEESDDYFLDFAGRSSGARTQWTLGANYAKQNVIRGGSVPVEFEDPDLDVPDDGETGRIDEWRRRTLWRIAPGMSYELSERSDIGLGLGYRDVSYSPQLPGEAIDYNDARLDTFHAYDLSPNSRFLTTVYVSQFDVVDSDNDSTSYGLRGRYERDFNEVHGFHIDVGVQRNELDNPGPTGDDATTGAVFDAGYRRSWERTEFRIGGGRSVQPSGTGFLREVDRIRLNLRHRFQPRWFGELGAVFQTTQGLDTQGDSDQRDYYRVLGRVGYEISRSWTVEGSYAFTRQDYENVPGEAERNEIFLSVNYQPLGRAW
jgi:hypothetical protein